MPIPSITVAAVAVSIPTVIPVAITPIIDLGRRFRINGGSVGLLVV